MTVVERVTYFADDTHPSLVMRGNVSETAQLIIYFNNRMLVKGVSEHTPDGDGYEAKFSFETGDLNEDVGEYDAVVRDGEIEYDLKIRIEDPNFGEQEIEINRLDEVIDIMGGEDE